MADIRITRILYMEDNPGLSALLQKNLQRRGFLVDTAARMGGDEFVGICGTIVTSEDAVVVARKILGALTAPFCIKGRDCTIGASIGISLYPADGSDAEKLLNKTDRAMYRVKQCGSGGLALCNDLKNAGPN